MRLGVKRGSKQTTGKMSVGYRWVLALRKISFVVVVNRWLRSSFRKESGTS